jgi:hypothetical protein
MHASGQNSEGVPNLEFRTYEKDAQVIAEVPEKEREREGGRGGWEVGRQVEREGGKMLQL